MTREESIQGTVDADIGGARGDTDIGDAGGSEGGAGGDTDIGGAGGTEGIDLEDVGSFGVPRGNGGGAVGNIDADIGGTGGTEGIELEDISIFGVLGGSREGAVRNTDAGGSSSRNSSRSARLTAGHGVLLRRKLAPVLAYHEQRKFAESLLDCSLRFFFDMTREKSIQGAVDADIGGAGGDTDIGDARGSEGGAGGILILVVQEEVKALSLKMLVVLEFLGAAEGVLWGILMLILVVQEEVKALSLKILVLEFLGAAERVLSEY
ncbi:hypothetical protein GH714_018780 [Hevea brasiliensis]|uniref:Uncharacterized protein n=1 Tax=Hevea brasiliensis TaxID=3981 RepID=A0A6A6KUQ8_HEVBR|nr:hypothetical protein GH714_018780 [Hevea brasiliensis]